MVLVYALLAVLGVAGTWYFNIQSARAGEDYIAGWFASSAASSAAVDLIVVAIAVCLFIVLEARRQRMNPLVAGALVPLSFLVAVAFTFPLFLAWRTWHLKHDERSFQPRDDEAVAR